MKPNKNGTYELLYIAWFLLALNRSSANAFEVRFQDHLQRVDQQQ